MRRWAWAFVAAVTLAVWAPVLTYWWVDTWDDAVFILGNPHVTHWSWAWMATTQWYGHWMPLTWISYCANYALFGFYPASWHAVNIGLHTISAVLFFFIAQRLVGSTLGAVFAALLFSVHPLRMESVAWLSERKDVLMGAFFLGAALLWLQGRRRWSFVAFVAACASKSPAVTLPIMLLLMDWYRHREGGWRVRDHLRWQLAPFFAVSVALVRNGRTVLGVVYDPHSDEAYYASAGGGAFMNGTPLPIKLPPASLNRCMAGIDLKRIDRQLAGRLALEHPFASQRNLGASTLDWCYVAAGRMHIYLHGGQKMWDYAAGYLILEEAGGAVCGLNGADFLAGDPWCRSALAAQTPELLAQWRAWVASRLNMAAEAAI